MPLPPSGAVIVTKMGGNNDFMEDILQADDIPLTITGTSYGALDVTGTNIQSALDDLVDTLAASSSIDIYSETHEPTGFINRTDSQISFDNQSRVVSISPVSASYSIYLQGVKHAHTTTESGQISNTTGTYYSYFDASNSFIVSTNFWDLYTTVPVAVVYWNATLGSGILMEERHGITMDAATHTHLHHSRGTVVVDGFAISGYSLDPGAPTSGTNTFGTDSGRILDEDILLTLSGLPDAGPYSLFYRSGTAGDWFFNTNYALPYYRGTTYAQYNQLNGATWQLTDATNSQYLNYYLCATNATSAAFKYILIPGQQVHSTKAAALAETVNELATGNLPFQEMAPLYQITLFTNNSYPPAVGSCRITNVKRIIGTNISITSNFLLSDHSALSGRSTPDSHPLSAISTSTSGAVLFGAGATIYEDPQLTWDKDLNLLSVSGNIGISSETASRATYFDASKNLKSSTTTSTELGYLSGVTSAIQSQLDQKNSLIGSLDGQPRTTDGATLLSGTLYFQTANGSYPGLVSISGQTFAGLKTFSSQITATSGISISDGGNLVFGSTTGTKIATASGQKIGVWGSTPVIRPGPYSITNSETRRTIDLNSYTQEELADLLATFILDLQSIGWVG